MVSSSQNKIYDGLRSIWVEATAEEIVRQTLLRRMIEELGYPKELLVVEKELSTLPHLRQQSVPARRLDILCYGKDIHPDYALYPLLLIECKKERLSPQAQEQLLGYNAFVKAYFVAAVGNEQVLFAYKANEGYSLLNFLPPYAQLLLSLKHG